VRSTRQPGHKCLVLCVSSGHPRASPTANRSTCRSIFVGKTASDISSLEPRDGRHGETHKAPGRAAAGVTLSTSGRAGYLPPRRCCSAAKRHSEYAHSRAQARHARAPGLRGRSFGPLASQHAGCCMRFCSSATPQRRAVKQSMSSGAEASRGVRRLLRAITTSLFNRARPQLTRAELAAPSHNKA